MDEPQAPRAVPNGNVIVSSPGMHELADQVAAHLQPYGDSFSRLKLDAMTFANNEFIAKVPGTVRRKHVFFLHGLQQPSPNEALMRMLIANEALMRSSVGEITLVIPYICYLRQDRRDDRPDESGVKKRSPITAKLVASLIEKNPAVRNIITLDMHADQEEGFFERVSVDNIRGMTVHAEYFREIFRGDFDNVLVIGPDFGSAVRARRFAKALDPETPVSLIEKTRPGPNEAEILSFIGLQPGGKDVIIYDDMIDTGTTIEKAARFTLEHGARSVHVCVTHGLFSRNAEEKFQDAPFTVVVTPTIPRPDYYWDEHSSWLKCVSIDRLLADAIYESSIVGGSISKLSP